MSLAQLHQTWEQLYDDEYSQSLARDLLSLRGTSIWLELLIDHPEMLGSQLYFNVCAHRFMLHPDYSVEERKHAILSLLFFAEEQHEHQLSQQLDLLEIAGLLFQVVPFLHSPIVDREQQLLSRIFLSTVLLPAGEFEQGAMNREPDTYDWERPRHRVTLTRSVHMLCYPVTQLLYAQLVSESPSLFKGPVNPVEYVSWYDALRFANLLSLKHGLQPVYSDLDETPQADFFASGWRLPTESEWEYAARAGSSYRYSGGDELDWCAWFWDNGGVQTQPVGQKRPNGFGLYDMSGNVFEWCWDGYDSQAYQRGACVDPTGRSDEDRKVRRGGSWYRQRVDLGVSRRFHAPSIEKTGEQGFRLCRAAGLSNK